MLTALERELGGRGASWSHPEGGHVVWLELPHGMRGEELLERARDRVAFVPGTGFFLPGRGGESEARLAFSYARPADIDEGITRLVALVPAAAAA
jgi:2-aminoadipate transaminase